MEEEYQKLKIVDNNEKIKVEINDNEIKNIKEYQIKRNAKNNRLVEATLVIVASPNIEIKKSF